MTKFSLDITNWITKARGNVDEAVQHVVAEVGARLVERTPVDEGTARANWKAELGSYSTSTTKDKDPSGTSTPAEIAAVAEGVKAGDVVFVTNSLPYIGQLEHGSSKQAPRGMVSVTAREFQAIAREAAEKLK